MTQSEKQKAEDDLAQDRLKSQKDVLWGLHQEHRAHARHNETLRATVNNMLIIASVAAIGFVTYDKALSRGDSAAAWLLIGIGFLGFFFSASYTERTLKHKTRAREYQEELDSTVFKEPVGRTLGKVIGDANSKHKGSYVGKIGKVSSSHLFWVILPLVIMSAGIALLIVCSGVEDPLRTC
ncbi:MAG TPA: hypothetical protein VN256_24765 [Pyrinomonadaceae bacterium]|nr:hypothetical protein [Pyrinomonadaceae bacterium]